MTDDNVMELVTRGGQTFFAPAHDRDSKITNVKKWDSAFRVYAAIYSEANPTRAAEIWQYIYVIHKAASNYYWDNVAFYDFTFRQLMARKPWRSWSKTYNQAWNLAMIDPISKNNNSGKNFQGSGGGQQQKRDWRDDCCWRYNKNRCNKTANDCKFDHRCTYCGGWNHEYFNCRKRLRKQSGGGNSETSHNKPSATAQHVPPSMPAASSTAK